MHNEYKRKADRFSTKGIMVWLENLRVAEKIMKNTSFLKGFFSKAFASIRQQGESWTISPIEPERLEVRDLLAR